MSEKITHSMVGSLRFCSDIAARASHILDRSDREGTSGRHANCVSAIITLTRVLLRHSATDLHSNNSSRSRRRHQESRELVASATTPMPDHAGAELQGDEPIRTEPQTRENLMRWQFPELLRVAVHLRTPDSNECAVGRRRVGSAGSLAPV